MFLIESKVLKNANITYYLPKTIFRNPLKKKEIQKKIVKTCSEHRTLAMIICPRNPKEPQGK